MTRTASFLDSNGGSQGALKLTDSPNTFRVNLLSAQHFSHPLRWWCEVERLSMPRSMRFVTNETLPDTPLRPYHAIRSDVLSGTVPFVLAIVPPSPPSEAT